MIAISANNLIQEERTAKITFNILEPVLKYFFKVYGFFKKLSGIIGIIILFPLILIIVSIIYLISYFNLKRLNNKLKGFTLDFENIIKDLENSVLVDSHNKTKESLDKLLSILSLVNHKSRILYIFNPLRHQINISASLISEMELILRLKLYPEQNEIQFSYAELKEFRESLNSFSTDDSDIYCCSLNLA